MGLSAGTPVFRKQNETFTSTSSGTIIDVSNTPFRDFTLGVKATGAVVSWTVLLEGSLDGTNFSTILSHTNLIGSGNTVFSGANTTVCLYFRVRCTAILLGLGTNIEAIAVGA